MWYKNVLNSLRCTIESVRSPPVSPKFESLVIGRSKQQAMNMYQATIRKAVSQSIEEKLHGTHGLVQKRQCCHAWLFWLCPWSILCEKNYKFSRLKFAATDKPNKPTARSAGTCEEGKVNTCGCKQCEYFKALERQVL